MDVIAGGTSHSPTAITAGGPVTSSSVPTAQRARKLVYAPDLDGRADAGEIVWTWVVYEGDPTRGQDCPVLVVGRDRRTLFGLMLSSLERHAEDHDWSGSVAAVGITAANQAGFGWTECSRCPKGASVAKTRSWTAR